jgi:peptidyl-prolyl cis-trans isomerase SurA
MKKAILIPVVAATLFVFQQPANAQAKHKTPVKPVKPVAAAVAPTPVVNDPALLIIAGETIPKSEFERVYRKNNRDSVFTETAIRDYMDLYINYKLKVKEAESMKMDTSEAFTNELAGYRKQLSQPYLTDRDVNENLVKEAYDRLNKDVHAQHILLKLAADALPKDTVACYNRAMKMREALLKGGDFSKMARDSSEDPSAKENNGDLGYFTGMQMVYPFETAAYNTKPGSISMPVRTRFGYHIIKVLDVRPAQGEIHAAHIMVRAAKDAPDSTIKAAEAKIKEAYAALKGGAVWDSVVNKYSEDKGSAKRGGELPWFGTGRMVPEFEKAAFALKNPKDYSEIVKTSYGFHIIQLLERRKVASFDEKKAELKQMITRDSRNDASRASMVAKLKKDYHFVELTKNRDEFISKLDSNLVNGEWDMTTVDKLVKPLFTLNDSTPTTYTQVDFAKYVSTHQTKRTGTSAQAIGLGMYDTWVSDECISYEEKHLDKKYPEFRNLMKEYRDGILLFDLTDKMVWTKAVKDSTGLAAFYDKNKNNYLWGERCQAVIYSCVNEKVAADFRKQLNKGKKSADEIIAAINKETPNSITKKEGKFNHGDNDILEGGKWVEGVLSADIPRNNMINIFKITTVIPMQPKSLEEAKGVATADYQSFLEKEWIENLRKKYSVQVVNPVLETLWKK